MTDDLMMRISLLGDGNAWPSTIELINDLADRIEALTAENERLRRENRALNQEMTEIERDRDISLRGYPGYD